MALPVAQLGYMPNTSAPGSIPTYRKSNMWQELAQQVLAQVAQQAVGNTLQRDYATQAAGQTLQDPVKVTPGNAGTTMPVAPQDAPWYSKMLQGPQMNSQQYGQMQAQRAASSEAAKNRQFTGGENSADRQTRVAEGAAERQSRKDLQNQQVTQAAEQFAKTHSLRSDEFRLQKDVVENRMVNDSAGLALEGVKVANDTTRTQAASGLQAAQERAAVELSQQYAKYATDYAKQALAAQAMNQPVPPQMSYLEFIKQYQTGRPAVGLQAFPTSP